MDGWIKSARSPANSLLQYSSLTVFALWWSCPFSNLSPFFGLENLPLVPKHCRNNEKQFSLLLSGWLKKGDWEAGAGWERSAGRPWKWPEALYWKPGFWKLKIGKLIPYNKPKSLCAILGSAPPSWGFSGTQAERRMRTACQKVHRFTERAGTHPQAQLPEPKSVLQRGLLRRPVFPATAAGWKNRETALK